MEDFKIWTGGDEELNNLVLNWLDENGYEWCNGKKIYDVSIDSSKKYFIYTSLHGLKYGDFREVYDIRDAKELDICQLSRVYNFDEDEFLNLL